MSSGEYSVESVEDRVDLVAEMADEARKFFDREFTGTPPGYTEPDPETFKAWFEGQMAASPPVPMVTPEGQPIVASPWVTALAYADGGKDIINRYLRVTRGGEA